MEIDPLLTLFYFRILRSVIQVSEETIKFRNRALELYEQGSYRVLEINDKTVESQNQVNLHNFKRKKVSRKFFF